MLTDRKLFSKIDKIQQRYAQLRFVSVAGIDMEMAQTKEHFRSEPEELKYKPAPVGTRWGDSWLTAWFRGDVTVPGGFPGGRLFLRASTGGETLLFVNARAMGVFDDNHPVVAVKLDARAGQKLHIALEAYSGHSFPGTQPQDSGIVVPRNCRTFEGAELLWEREDVTAFVFDLRTLVGLMHALDDSGLRKGKIIAGLARVAQVVDAMPAETSEESWRPKLAQARETMAPLLAAQNGTTAPYIGLIGHSHIDTAWLWPVAETWRKCARTFASMLNLMEQYPEVIFIQPAPCHAEAVRDMYPELFARVQKMAKSGRWEPNGAMWVEPDCNIPSGESFVRQLLVGQTAVKEMFGYRADTLWLPDVFGYSAALPQLLRGAGVEFFCTTKIGWNDTTRFPYDSFVWKGIDGSEVVSHYNTIHCWPDPETLVSQWNWVQHKDVQDRRLMSYGFGDGGGGPQAEMMEIARRVQDLEGCPRTGHTTVSRFMRDLRDEMAPLPEFCGELYLEFHRGTLTSIAPIKRGNRKAELALRDAEWLCTLASLRGRDYPAEQLLQTWKTLLLNQFHDILPGSSIARVDDEAIADLARCVREAEGLSAAAAQALGALPADRSSRSKAGPESPTRAVLVLNSLSWDRRGEIALTGVPEGLLPTGPGLEAQWVRSFDRVDRLLIGGLCLPALGAVTVDLAEGTAEADGPFRVGRDEIETPFAVVRFDEIGRIVSLLDRESGREIVAPGGALNSLLIGEDVPDQYDNWEIDSDQELQMRLERRLLKRELVAEGPLQLRVRCVYELGEGSRLTQDVVFHSTTPRIDFETMVDWDEKHKLLKAAFDLDVLADFARHEIQYGHVERPTHRNLPGDRARFEVCAHKWTDLSETGFGVALLNDCKYGLSVHGKTIGLTLLKAGTHPDDRGDRGRHLMTYALLPHNGPFRAESVIRPAYELNVPVLTYPAAEDAEGFEGLVQVDRPNVIVESVKWAEDGKGFVVRLYEAEKTGCQVRLSFGVPVKRAMETNLLEEEIGKLKVSKGVVDLYLRPFEVKTVVCGV